MLESILYAGVDQDILVKMALDALRQFHGAQVQSLLPFEIAPSGSILVTSSFGKFPSRFARVVRPEDYQRRNILRPTAALYAKEVLALNKAREQLACERVAHFLDALRAIHCQLTGQPYPVTRRKRPPYSSGRRARLAREDGIVPPYYLPL